MTYGGVALVGSGRRNGALGAFLVLGVRLNAVNDVGFAAASADAFFCENG